MPQGVRNRIDRIVLVEFGSITAGPDLTLLPALREVSIILEHRVDQPTFVESDRMTKEDLREYIFNQEFLLETMRQRLALIRERHGWIDRLLQNSNWPFDVVFAGEIFICGYHPLWRQLEVRQGRVGTFGVVSSSPLLAIWSLSRCVLTSEKTSCSIMTSRALWHRPGRSREH
jgi:hypothetical protein